MRVYSIVVLLLCGLCAHAGVAGVCQHLFESHDLTRHANVGVLVEDLTSGEEIDSYRADNLLPTASTMKVISTCSALELLGADYRWRTYLESDAPLQDGVLRGALYVRGTGDPTLGSKDFGGASVLSDWVSALRAQGVRAIEGGVVADLSAFDNGDNMNEGWTFGDMGNYYGMGVFSLNWRDNTMLIHLSSGAVGSKSEVVGIEPADSLVHFTSYLSCADSEQDNGYAHGVAFNYERTLTGSIPAGKGVFTIRGDLPNPGLLLARELTEALRAGGICVAESPRFVLNSSASEVAGRELLYVHESAPLSEVVYETNIWSNNLFAEAIFRTLGLQAGHPSGVDDSRLAVRHCWESRGVSFSPTIMVDGCGLAPQNGIAPRTFVDILRYMYSSVNYPVLLESLPTSGQSGTLRTMLRGTPLAGRVHAKSGTIAHLRSYCGYIQMQNGHVWAFSIVVHNANGSSMDVRRLIEEYLLTITRGQ